MMAAAPRDSSGAAGHSPSEGSGDYRPDSARTTRPHAGEAIQDTRKWPGLVLVGVGIVLMALTLTAAGYGFMGWVVVGSIAGALSLGSGIALMMLEHRRITTLDRKESA